MKYVFILSLLFSFAANGQKVQSTTIQNANTVNIGGGSISNGSNSADTTKKRVDLYFIFGKGTTFKLLHQALTSPGDVTPNQMKALDEWLLKELMVADTTKHK